MCSCKDNRRVVAVCFKQYMWPSLRKPALCSELEEHKAGFRREGHIYCFADRDQALCRRVVKKPWSRHPISNTANPPDHPTRTSGRGSGMKLGVLGVFFLKCSFINWWQGVTWYYCILKLMGKCRLSTSGGWVVIRQNIYIYLYMLKGG